MVEGNRYGEKGQIWWNATDMVKRNRYGEKEQI